MLFLCRFVWFVDQHFASLLTRHSAGGSRFSVIPKCVCIYTCMPESSLYSYFEYTMMIYCVCASTGSWRRRRVDSNHDLAQINSARVCSHRIAENAKREWMGLSARGTHCLGAHAYMYAHGWGMVLLCGWWWFDNDDDDDKVGVNVNEPTSTAVCVCGELNMWFLGARFCVDINIWKYIYRLCSTIWVNRIYETRSSLVCLVGFWIGESAKVTSKFWGIRMVIWGLVAHRIWDKCKAMNVINFGKRKMCQCVF